MRSPIENQAIALAGLLQTCSQVDQLAREGAIDSNDFATALKALFVFDPKDTEDVYGGIANVKPGLQILNNLLGKKPGKHDREILRYAIGSLHLQKLLSRKDSMLSIVASRLEHIAFKSEHFSGESDDIATSVAGLYSDTLSSFRFRIQVTGNMQHLQQTRVANQIRALLFSAVRSAMLWRQLGGTKPGLFWNRRRLLASTETLLASIN